MSGCKKTENSCIQDKKIALIHQSYEFMQRDISEIKKSLDNFMEVLEKYYAKKSDCEEHWRRLDKMERIISRITWLVIIAVLGALLSKIIV